MKTFFELLIVITIVTVTPIFYNLGMVIAVKCNGGKIRNFKIGTGKEIFHYKKFHLNSEIYNSTTIKYYDIANSKKNALICICISGPLVNLLFGIIFGILILLGFVETTNVILFFIFYNSYYGIKNLIPTTWSNGYNSAGKILTQLYKYGYGSALSEYNNNMKEYSVVMRTEDLIDQNKFEDALFLLDELLENENKFSLAYFYRGVAYEKLGKYNEAIDNYNSYIKYKPESFYGYVDIGLCYCYLGDMDNYYKYTYEAYKINSEMPTILNNLADYYNKIGNYDEAFQYAKKAIKIDPSDAGLYCTLSETYLLSKNMDKFYEYIELALKKGHGVEKLYTNNFIKNILDDTKLKAIISKYSL